MGTRLPGEFEQVVLLTVAAFEDDATGRDVYESIVTTTGRDVSVAAIHITLTRLSEKGWAECQTSPPGPGEGGKPRRRYRLAAEGAARLADQRGQWAACGRRQEPIRSWAEGKDEVAHSAWPCAAPHSGAPSRSVSR